MRRRWASNMGFEIPSLVSTQHAGKQEPINVRPRRGKIVTTGIRQPCDDVYVSADYSVDDARIVADDLIDDLQGWNLCISESPFADLAGGLTRQFGRNGSVQIDRDLLKRPLGSNVKPFLTRVRQRPFVDLGERRQSPECPSRSGNVTVRYTKAATFESRSIARVMVSSFLQNAKRVK